MKKSIFVFIAGLFILILASGIASAESSLVSQVADILAEESTQTEIKVGILEFSISGGIASEKNTQEMANTKTHVTEDFEADLFQAIKKKGLKSKVSFIERTRLNEILEEKKMSMTGLTEQNAASIGNIAGLDYIIMPSIRISGDNTSYIAKVLRVKDAKTEDSRYCESGRQ